VSTFCQPVAAGKTLCTRTLKVHNDVGRLFHLNFYIRGSIYTDSASLSVGRSVHGTWPLDLGFFWHSFHLTAVFFLSFVSRRCLALCWLYTNIDACDRHPSSRNACAQKSPSKVRAKKTASRDAGAHRVTSATCIGACWRFDFRPRSLCSPSVACANARPARSACVVINRELSARVRYRRCFLRSPYVIGQTIIFLPCDFYLLLSSFFLFFSSPNLSGRRLDVCHKLTSTHGVAIVRI